MDSYVPQVSWFDRNIVGGFMFDPVVRLVDVHTVNAPETLGPIVIPDSVGGEYTTVLMSIPRKTTLTPLIFDNAACVMTVTAEASFDGEQSWVPAGAFTCFGGIHTTIAGGEAATSSMSVVYPDLPNRRMLVTI